tara:strand:- start:97 stop:720 length:624 start_codon:yes stop_codon:yes gene_type:complete
MATIPNTQKFHTVADATDTKEYGSAQLAAGRTVFTMQDILDTVVVGGGVDGSGTAGFIPLWSDSNTIGDSIISATGSAATITGNLTMTGFATSVSTTGGSSATTLTTKDYVDGLASNYATAAQGTLATNALPLAGGTLTGALTTLGVSATDVVANSFAVDALQAAPLSATAAGTLGEIRYALDGGVHYIYLCIATDTWQRVALATWV